METLEFNFSNTFSLSIAEFIQITKRLLAATGEPGHIVISIALQVCAAGGVEEHAKTMLPDSVWMNDIYPELIRI